MNNDEELAALLKGPPSKEEGDLASKKRIRGVLRRTHTSLGQQQTLSFLLIQIWVTVAKALAPIFAGLAKRHAMAGQNPSPSNIPQKNQHSKQNKSGESNEHS